jgi:alanine dehydrogenase
MVIGVPKEIKKEEYRVGIIPSGVKELKGAGHIVLVEKGAGEGSGFPDGEYIEADADVVGKKVLFEKSDLIVKVKEPLPGEYDFFKSGQAVFTYLHLAPNRELTEFLLKKEIASFGYETLEKGGGLPLLSPMSEIAGRMAPLMGAYYLQMIHGGSGVLSGGVAGVRPAKVLILGAGVVGSNAARVCIGLGMDTVVINKGIGKLQRLDELFVGRVHTLPFTMHDVAVEIREADIVIGAVLVPGARTPLLISREMLGTMKKGAVIVDVSVDQGGCADTSKPTTHDKPIYSVDGIVHYTVANMPGAYPMTATLALTNATLPYIKAIADVGIEQAISGDQSIKTALNTYRGKIVHTSVSEAFYKKG